MRCLAFLLILFLSFGATAGQLKEFEKAVEKKPQKSSSKSARSWDDDDDDDIGDAVLGGFFSGAFRGVRFLVYDWWAEPGDPYADVEPVFPVSTNALRVTVGDSSGIINTNSVEEVQPPASVPIVAEDRSGVVRTDKTREAKPPPNLAYISRPEDELEEEDDKAIGTHLLGKAGLPYVRFDYRWQYLDHNTAAHDYLLEAGYKYLAFFGRMSRYADHAASEKLNIDQYYGTIRLGACREDDLSWEVCPGIGGYVIEGDNRHGGLALTCPIIIYPSDYFGIEFRPAWAFVNENTISDYDISISGGYQYVQLRAGYRWLWIKGDGRWLNGPYAGLSVMF